jgi:S-adenosylmethionine:tRNA ribosyltransferase-isomerase
MHQERYGIGRAALEAMLRNATSDHPWITAVGTTSIRTLESLYAVGARSVRDGSAEQSMYVGHWEAFDPTLHGTPRADVVRALLAMTDFYNVDTLWGETQLMIAPGARFGFTDALITNFHQPGNTLLLLVAGVVGEDAWRDIYAEALANDYRFLSYGDSSLLFCRKP